ncbi:MAG: hypothetical protein ACR5KV_00100 [Wolbachia sp.]
MALSFSLVSKSISTKPGINLQHVEEAKLENSYNLVYKNLQIKPQNNKKGISTKSINVSSRYGDNDRKDDLSSNIEHIDTIEKVTENGKLILP